MAIDALAQHFIRLEIFQGLKPLQITEILRRSDRIVYRPGDLIAEEGTDADAAILVVAGEALRLVGPDLRTRAEPVPPGSLLMEMAMLVETEHGATVVARTPVRALRISRAELYEQMLDDPDLADHFMSKVTARLARVANDLRAIDELLAPPLQRLTPLRAHDALVH